jgi:hypothetical protein
MFKMGFNEKGTICSVDILKLWIMWISLWLTDFSGFCLSIEMWVNRISLFTGAVDNVDK